MTLLYNAMLVYIVARVITQEQITEPIRCFFLTHNCMMLHKLFSCIFCMSFYVAIVVVVLLGESWQEIPAYMFFTAASQKALE